MINHVTQVATHYRGKIYAWDVVNEAFADGSSGGRRDSNLQRTGNDWIEVAFRAARAADPGAKLCYNDYNIDNWTDAKTQAVYNMVQRLQVPRRADRLRRLPVPLHRRLAVPGNYRTTCPASPPSASTCRSPSSTSPGANQADIYAHRDQRLPARSPAAPASPCGASATATPGAAGETPLLFDGDGNKKAAYTAVLNALNAGAGGGTGTGCTATYVQGTVFGDRYNSTVNVTGSTSWIVTVTITPPQRISTTWSAAVSWDTSGNVMTARPNGSGNSFGFTTMFNGNSTARPSLSCRVG